jgi:DNA-binding MarR family transcriptional regulator
MGRGEEESSDVLEDMERALTVLVRQINLPRLHSQLAARAGVTLERGAYGVLTEIGEHGPLRLSDLADQLEVEVSTVSRHVKQLEAGGLVRREGDPDDGRAALLRLSPAGQRILRKLQVGRRAWMQELVEHWTAAEQRQFATLLDRFAEAGRAASARGGKTR